MEDQSHVHQQKNDHQIEAGKESPVSDGVKSFTPPPGVLKPITIQRKPNFIQRQQALPENEKPESLRPNSIQRMQRQQTGQSTTTQLKKSEEEQPLQLKQGVNQKSPGNKSSASNNLIQFRKKKKGPAEPSVEDYQKMNIESSTSDVSALVVNIYKKSYHVEYMGSFPAAIKKGLYNHAGTLLSGEESTPGRFPEYSTSSFAIQGKDFGYDAKKLKDYQGTTVFEFTRLKNNEKDGTPVLQVRELGKDNAPKLSDDEKLNQKKYFEKYFKLDSSWSDPQEIEILYSTVTKIPDGLLSQISGVTFKREAVHSSNPTTVTGNYVMEASGESTITLFNLAFKDRSFMRYGNKGIGFSTSLQFTIVHEIGHAMDSRKVRTAVMGKNAASKKYTSDSAELKKESEAMGRFEGNVDSYNKAMAKAVASNKLYKDSQKAALDARTEIGEGYDDQKAQYYIFYIQKETSTAFTKALEKDGGKALSDYGATEQDENFSEFFAFYILDGARLKRMRPNVYEYFSTTFPMK